MTDREGNARASFRRKVETLEHLATQREPPQWFPKNVAELVKWNDQDLGLTSWSSFSVAAPNGANADLRRRFDLALSKLKRGPGKSSKPPRGRSIPHRLALEEVKSLAEQNSVLLSKIGSLEREAARKDQYIDALEQRERQLVEALNKLLPLERRVVSKVAQ